MEENKSSKAAAEVLKLSRNKLFFGLRYMEQALFFLMPEESGQSFFGSDGKVLFYEKTYLLNRYLQAPDSVCCDYLHTVIHCLYQHPILARGQEKRFWDLAADIAAADVLGKTGIPWVTAQLPADCVETADKISRKVPLMSAAHISRFLQRGAAAEAQLGYSLEELEEMFRRDDHSCWNYQLGQEEEEREDGGEDADKTGDGSEDGRDGESRAEGGTEDDGEGDGEGEGLNRNTGLPGNNYNKGSSPEKDLQKLTEIWKDIAEKVMLNAQSFSAAQGEIPQSMVQNLQRLTRESYDYADFLRKFAVLNERMRTNMDEFDYIYYMYGLQRYGKIPLIEPLEYKEEYMVRDFVIAIDTSGSCQGVTVQNFLNKTYNILKQTENFSDKVVIHIIQCDAMIQEDVKITSLNALEDYMEHMELKGFGGTDFRPVFRYVDRLCREKEFTRLCGLIYFTDGWGTFPERPPEYKTAFVFVDREDNPFVPPWAMKLYLDADTEYAESKTPLQAVSGNFAGGQDEY